MIVSYTVRTSSQNPTVSIVQSRKLFDVGATRQEVSRSPVETGCSGKLRARKAGKRMECQTVDIFGEKYSKEKEGGNSRYGEWQRW